jgi:hypothetical protein
MKNGLQILIKFIQDNRWAKLFLILCFIALVIFMKIFDTNKNRQTVSDFYRTNDLTPGSQEPGTNSIHTGMKITKDMQTILEDRLRTETTENGLTKSDYSAGFKADPTTVFTDKDGVIQAIRKLPFDSKFTNMSEIVNNPDFGTPSFQMYVTDDYGTKLYVYLHKGIAFEVGQFSGEIVRIIEFTAATKESFLKLFPGKYSETPTYRGN